MSGTQTVTIRLEIERLRVELENFMDEDIYWRQRCNIQWAKEGNKNTQFSHMKATSSKRANRIFGLMNSNSQWCEELIDEILENMSPRVTSDMNQMLTTPYTSNEVIKALSQRAPLKSPGRDGFPVVFFKNYCNIIGSDIVSCS